MKKTRNKTENDDNISNNISIIYFLCTDTFPRHQARSETIFRKVLPTLIGFSHQGCIWCGGGIIYEGEVDGMQYPNFVF